MYQLIKNTITSIIPRRFLFEHEEKLRKIYSIFYSGNAYVCNVCSKKLHHFITTENSDLLCPNCGSLQRNRRLWQLLENEFLVSGSTVLDFSPSRCLYRKWIKRSDINYKSTDLSGDFIACHQWDITQMDCPGDTFDLILCYHILEHIPDDRLAMLELFRVLKRCGKILVQTPFTEGEIYEDDSIIAAKDRLHHFGQEDHVRIYSIDGLKSRLEVAGFNVDVRHYKNTMTQFGLSNDETILILTKP